MMNKLLGAPRVLGVVFVALLVLAVYLTYATFTKKFADYEEVTLRTTTTGLQLPNRADVKVRGVIVGEVLRTEADGLEGAEITLGIYPDEIDTVPANVTGAIVPKTLFGEKYVSLVVPESGPSGTIQAGSVIGKTEVSTEVEEVLNDLYPLLRTVKPADLNATLTAIATALEGRGDQLGENLETVDSYLNRLNPQIPLLLEDLEPTLPVLLSDLSTTGQVILSHIAGVEQLLVTYPPLIAAGPTGSTADGYGHVNLQFDYSVPPCTNGYLPPSEWRSTQDLTDGPIYPAECNSGAPYSMRGAKSAPAGTGGNASTPRYYSDTYDPATREVTGVRDRNGNPVRFNEPADLAVLGEDAWKWMLVGPVSGR